MRLTREGTTDDTNMEIEGYCISILLKLQNNKCAKCGEELDEYQIHHKRYGLDITVYDLELIHRKCHLQIHKYNPRAKKLI